MTANDIPIFRPLTGIFEPSAIRQLADGRFLIVEDEKAHPFSLFTIVPDGSVGSAALAPEAGEALAKLDDLEGLAVDPSGAIYAITSHSRDDDGDERKSREKLVRFRIENDRIVAPTVAGGLKSALVASHPVLAAAAAIREVKGGGGLNIEALEIGPDQQGLLVGLRSPLLDHRAIVARVENPAAFIGGSEPPRIAVPLISLDLGGDGIRGLSWIPALDGYLVIGGPVGRAKAQFQLWFWSGDRNDAARRVTVPGLPGFEHAEGVCPAVIDGRPRIVVVSDDGSRAEGRCARFLLLDPGQLQIAP